MTRKRGPVVARCYVLRADRNGRTWYVGYSRAGMTGVTNPREALEFDTLATARMARYVAILPEWRIWRRGKR